MTFQDTEVEVKKCAKIQIAEMTNMATKQSCLKEVNFQMAPIKRFHHVQG